MSQVRETSGATTSLLLRHTRARAGEAGVARVLARAAVPFSAAQLEDPGHWVDEGTRRRLVDAVVAELDDPRAPFHAARELVTDGRQHGMVLVLRAMGSPERVYHRMGRAAGRLTGAGRVVVEDVRPGEASIRYVPRDGDEGGTSAHDCAFLEGLLTQVPVLFGLPEAEVTRVAAADGPRGCRFAVRWSTAQGRSRADLEVEVDALRGQLAELQEAGADLAGTEDADDVLARLMDRAAASVLAPAYLAVAHARDGGRPHVHARGVPPERVDALAAALLAACDADREHEGALDARVLGRTAVVVDVASERRHHGRMAVLVDEPALDAAVSQTHRALLRAYARHAATRLDLLDALEDSRREARRAQDLLGLAHALATAADDRAVAGVVAGAVPGIVGCEGASVMLWDPARGALRTVGTGGLTPEQDAGLRSADVRADLVPELVELLTRRRPMLLEIAGASDGLRAVLAAVEAHAVFVVPLVAEDALLGIVTASWHDAPAPGRREEALDRITGIADQTSTALQNARLLATVRHQASHDALTGLPNRVLFARQLDESLRAAAPGTATAVLFCDVDRFKGVNDHLGHAAGDELLRQVAARLRGELRPGDGVGRLSGDEFAVRLDDADELAQVGAAQRVVDAPDQPFRIEGREVRITVSVGVAVHVGTDGRGERLLAAADGAMYEAKERGRNQVAVAGEVVSARVVPSLEAELARAAEAGQLRLYYQPVLDVSAGRPGVVGAEALLRWAHPRLGMLGPAAFLPLAEEAGLVTRLDLWAVRAACAALASWRTAAGDDAPLRVAVNLASRTLLDAELVPTVRAALTETGVPAERLHLELVESRALADLPGVVERLVELRRLGVRIALDDFGTGYSTLTWLQQLPIDQIKIDRSFVERLTTDVASVAVVRGVMALARELGVEVVAEGVEEAGQLALLRDVGCVYAQGYLLGRPGPALEPALRAAPDRGA